MSVHSPPGPLLSLFLLRSASAAAIVTVALASLLLPLCIAGQAHATQMVPASVEEMTQGAHAVVRGRVIAHSTRLEDGSVRTRAELDVDEVWAGEVPDTVVIEAPGGRYGDIATQVAGADVWTPGEEVVAFLIEVEPGVYRSLALSMSRFTVEEGMALRNVDNITWVRRLAGGELARTTPPVRALPLDELRERVFAARNDDGGQR